MDEILNASNNIVAAASNVLGLVDSILLKVEAVHQKKLSTENYLRAYYLEVINNIEIINCINMKKISSVKINSQVFQNFIGKLETQIGLSMLFTDDKEKTSLHGFLKSKGRINNANNKIVKYQNGKEVLENKKVVYENILQAVSFTVIKLEFLKQVSQLKDEDIEVYNKIIIEKRLVNIKERLIMIKHVMDSLDGIKEIAR